MTQDSTWSYRLFKLIITLVLSLFSLAALFPFILTVIVSVTDEQAILANGYTFFPAKLSLTAYRMVFEQQWIGRAYINSVLITGMGTGLCVLTSAMIGYGISLKRLKYRNAIAMYLFIPMVFHAGLVPWYLWVSRSLHLRNSLWALILPMLINPFWIFLMRNYFRTIPESLSESAEIDGAGPVYTFWKIILPLGKPIIATIVLFASLMYWNDYVMALWLIDRDKYYPLQYMLYKIQSLIAYMAQSSNVATTSAEGNIVLPSEGIQMATFVVALGPIVLVYPFVQKYFIQGIMIGAVKG